MTQLVRRLVRSRWFFTLLAALALSAVIWYFGPLIGIGALHPFISEFARIVAIGLLLVLWLVSNLLRELRAQARDKKLTQGVIAPAVDADATASAEELAAIGERLRAALQALRHAKLGGRSRRHLYELPWYMLIGPSGAGKTTALVNSGLNFPLAETKGGAPVQGVGGTRNCDWWFTDDAVLIDTAGRYTTQDDPTREKVEGAAWTGFLRLLKKHRPRQPLNGVLLAISLTDLAMLDEAERQAHARAMRKRVRELHDELGVRLPVYVLFTKADTIVGFSEFFDNLGREEREQVWGLTLPLDDGSEEGGAVARVAPEFDALLARLSERMLERVQQETDLQRRRLIYGFPQQVAALRDVAVEFLGEIFRPSRLEARPLLRGVYLTSGTQDGTSIDRLMGAMAASFGLQRQSVTAWSGAGRSYFLGRLLREVVFGESGLVSLDPKEERRRRWTYRAAYAACIVVLLLFAGLWTASYSGNAALIAQVGHVTDEYKAQYAAIERLGPANTELPPLLPALATLRAMPDGYDQRESETPLTMTFGLYQGNKITGAAVDSYYRALGNLLQPRLLARLEAVMQANLDEKKTEFLYEALKAYLILGRQHDLDAAPVETFLKADFEREFPGDDAATTRDQLASHLHALLERPVPQVALNGPLVDQVREILNRKSLADYSYGWLMSSHAVKSLPEWTVADKATPGGSRVFVLRSGKPLSNGLPGIFTYNGYHSTFKLQALGVLTNLNSTAWVLGPNVHGAPEKLSRDVLGLYLDDYVRVWDGMIADIALQPLGDRAAAIDKLSLIAAPASPFRNLLQAIDAETQLSRPAALDAEASAAQAKAQKIGEKSLGLVAGAGRGALSMEGNQMADIFAQALGDAPGGGKVADPTQRVDDHFRSLHTFVAGSPDSKDAPPMEAAIQKIDGIYKSLNEAANAASPGQVAVAAIANGGGAGGAAAAGLQDVAKGAPEPVAKMLQAVAQGGAAVTASDATQLLADTWRSKVLPYCQDAFNRYPFVAGSAEEVPPADFAKVLGPGGLIDGFFNDNLKPFVDTTHRPWRWQAGGQAKLGFSGGTLEQFENAALIRDALFGNGGQMQVGFALKPADLSPQIARATLDIGGQSVVSQHAAPESQHVLWPGPDGKRLVRITLAPAGGGQSEVVDRDGPWALLKLLDTAHVTPSTRDHFLVTFSGAGGTASFEIEADSVYNVFSLAALRGFHCPSQL